MPFKKIVIYIFTSLIVTSLLAYYVSKSTNVNYEDPSTFGAKTTLVFDNTSKEYFHCQDFRDIDKCLVYSKGKGIYLWLGNSQLHSINQYEIGEKTATSIVFNSLKADNLNLIAITQPNSNFQEQLIILNLLISKKIKMYRLILPIVFDDMRESSIRDSLSIYMNNGDINHEFISSELGLEILKKINIIDASLASSLTNTNQNYLENYINSILNECCYVWRIRGDVRSSIYTALYKFRNFIFQITPSTERKIIKTSYVDNLKALNEIINICNINKIKIIGYVAPIRNDIKIPYNANEYHDFKVEIRKIILANPGNQFLNLENIVPEKYWGQKDSTGIHGDSEIDFMHFSSQGHKLLAEKILQHIRD
jgi:hypothetical protein